jgi:hypothetical protein
MCKASKQLLKCKSSTAKSGQPKENDRTNYLSACARRR